MAAAQDGSIQERLVTVFGGSGFLGRHVVRALVKRGWRVRVAVRRPDLAGFLQPLGQVGQIQAVQANLRFPESVAAALEGASAAVNSVGLLFERGAQDFSAVHVEGARAIAAAAAAHGLSSLVHLSALGASVESASAYARSKAAGEEAVLAHHPRSVILRPSLVFGPEDNFFNRFASLAPFMPFLPLIGGGHTRFQPVSVEDVAEAAARAVEGQARQSIYELGGPEILTFKEILQLVLRETQRRRLLVPVPFALARLKAFFLQQLPTPLLTVDQVRLLETDNVVSPKARHEQRTLGGLGLQPTALASVLPGYLARFRPGGQYAALKRF